MTVGTSIPVSISLLDPMLDEQAAAILAPATGAGTIERGRDLLAVARADDTATIVGLIAEGELAAVYILRKIQWMNEIDCLAVAANQRRRGHGRACLYDALLRSGRRPLVVETDDEALACYKRVGFKLVGKRRRPDGGVRYRLGWHAPLPKPNGSVGEVCS